MKKESGKIRAAAVALCCAVIFQTAAFAGAAEKSGEVVLYPEEQRERREFEYSHLPDILKTSPAPETDTSDKNYDVSGVTAHKYTGKKVTAIPENLKKPDARGGVVLKPNKGAWDFSVKDGVDYGSNRDVMQLEWMDLGGGSGCYRYKITKTHKMSQAVYTRPADRTVFDMKPNRNYLVSILLWADWTVIGEDGSTRECIVDLCAGSRPKADVPGRAAVDQRMGLPPYTNGWMRFEYICSPGLMEVEGFFPMIQSWQFDYGIDDNMICIADFSVIELPEVTDVQPYKQNEGVTFRGSAGGLDMKVESAEETEAAITVNTTGAEYVFNKADNTISARQKINLRREVSSWTSSTPLKDLKIHSKTDTECVISSPEITFGVQMDGMLFLTPHNGDVRLECTSKISGLWNRFNFGFLTCIDDYGGFTVTPDLPEGTGKLCKTEVLTDGLDFVNIPFDNSSALIDGNKMHPHWNEITNCKPGWRIAWTISPGERLAIGTFPPREYDWKKSFNMTYENRNWDSRDTYAADRSDLNVQVATIFDASDRAYAVEWTPFFTYNSHEKGFMQQIKSAHDAGLQAITYMPQYFFYNKYTPDEWVANLKRVRDRYGIDGVYSDGTSSEHQWVTAYEASRMARQVFADGTMIVHNTGHPANGGAPLSSPGHYLPCLDTYWNATLKTESLQYSDLTPPLLKYTVTQYNTSNIVGYAKGDAWKYINEKGELELLSKGVWPMIVLEQNGRCRIELGDDYFKRTYVVFLRQLEKLWEEKGSEEFFYERYFAPKVRELIRPEMEKFGDQVELDLIFSDEGAEKTLGIYDVNVSAKKAADNNGYIELRGKRSHEKGELLKRIAAVSGPVNVEYKFKVSERGDFAHSFTDNYGNRGAEIMFGSDGKLKAKNAAGCYVNIGKYERNKWYNVRLEINTDSGTYSVYLDDKLIKGGLKLDENFYYFTELKFSGGGYGSVCCLDDIKVINKW